MRWQLDGLARAVVAALLGVGLHAEAFGECLGDTNDDGVVDGSDVAVVATELGTTECGSPQLVDPVTGMEFALVPAGTYAMGDVFGEGNPSELPVHDVRFATRFAIGKYEVTQAQWEAVMGSNPSGFSGCPDCPVESVSWEDVRDFIAQLNALSGRTYRLPTEAEWEYAARNGGEQWRYCGWSNDLNVPDYAWYAENSDGHTHPVGRKVPNRLGLYDMCGNMWEWVQDCWNQDYRGAPVDGSAWLSGDCGQRVIRGGSWNNPLGDVRSAVRLKIPTDDGYIYIGFRLAQDLE